MATDVVIPTDLWDEDSEAAITAWLVSDGAQVASLGECWERCGALEERSF